MFSCLTEIDFRKYGIVLMYSLPIPVYVVSNLILQLQNYLYYFYILVRQQNHKIYLEKLLLQNENLRLMEENRQFRACLELLKVRQDYMEVEQSKLKTQVHQIEAQHLEFHATLKQI